MANLDSPRQFGVARLRARIVAAARRRHGYRGFVVAYPREDLLRVRFDCRLCASWLAGDSLCSGAVAGFRNRNIFLPMDDLAGNDRLCITSLAIRDGYVVGAFSCSKCRDPRDT